MSEPKRVIVGVTGSIAAYKACELVRLLVRDGHEVVPILTPGAERFVSLETFEALARRETPRDLYPHLAQADLLVIAPLSASTLAKLAHGFADTVLTEAALAFRGPVLLAPAMNVRMWEHPATRVNAALVVERGCELIGPDSGELAEGEVGAGRMAEPEAIAARCRELLGAAGESWPASACSSPPAEPASRSTRCGSSATAPPERWASRSPPRPRGAGPT